MKLRFENLLQNLKIWQTMAQFGSPLDQTEVRYLHEYGLDGPAHRAYCCMSWLWGQWLLNSAPEEIGNRVEFLVERGLEAEATSSLFHKRPIHQLFLLHCAIFASSETQLKKVAQRVMDASGYKAYTPDNNGELYTSAFCGMLKYWILADQERAVQQSEIAFKAYRDISFRAAAKPLIAPWLKRDWKAFVKSQHKDFETRWAKARKDGTVKSESAQETVVDIQNVRHIGQCWCWSHCGLALLAYRQGVEVVTDDFRFPPHALKCVPR